MVQLQLPLNYAAADNYIIKQMADESFSVGEYADWNISYAVMEKLFYDKLIMEKRSEETFRNY